MNDLEKKLIKDIINSNYGITANKNYVDTDNVNFNKIIRNIFDIKRFLYKQCDFSNYHYITNYIMILDKTIIILAKLKECEETSATKCFTTMNEIKKLIDERL